MNTFFTFVLTVNDYVREFRWYKHEKQIKFYTYFVESQGVRKK